MAFLRNWALEKDYVAGVKEGIKTREKVPGRCHTAKSDLPNYLAIEWELIYGTALLCL